jgi:hypothetical protein
MLGWHERATDHRRPGDAGRVPTVGPGQADAGAVMRVAMSDTEFANRAAGGPATGRTRPPCPRLIRVGIAALYLLDLVVGAWALFAPRAFYDYFPGGPFRWIKPFGPYSTHLVADVGGAYLMMATLLALAALTAGREMVRVALLAVLVQAAIHLVWHLLHLSMLGDARNAAGLITILVVALTLPALLFGRTFRPFPSTRATTTKRSRRLPEKER